MPAIRAPVLIFAATKVLVSYKNQGLENNNVSDKAVVSATKKHFSAEFSPSKKLVKEASSGGRIVATRIIAKTNNEKSE